MRNLLRIDLSNRQFIIEAVPEKYRLLGGRGLTSRIVADEVPPTCDALGKRNKLVFACGLLAGTGASSTNRISIGAKSPLTGGIKEANGGGLTAYNLARLGYRALILEGTVLPGASQIIIVDENSVTFEDAGDLWGLRTFDTMEKLWERFGKKAAYALIGPAGEMKMNLAGVANTDMEGRPTRYSARGGVGAVMGSKGIKAIVIKHTTSPCVYVEDEQLWKEAIKRYTNVVQTGPVTAEVLPQFGTALTMEQMSALGAAVVHNFRKGQVEDIESFGGKKLREVILERGGEGSTTHSCVPGCIVKCSNVFADRQGKEINSPMEYENLGFLGSNLALYDLDGVNYLNHICNDLGIDTIETGAVLAVAAEEGLAKFGNFEDFKNLLDEVAKGSPLGRLLGMGATGLAKAFGSTRFASCKGQTIGAYDPRAMKVNGVTYLTSPMGGDHTAGNGLFLQIDHPNPEGKVQVSFNCQVASAWTDAFGLCAFLRTVHFIDPTVLPQALKARFGGEWSQDTFNEIGRETLRTEISFNRKAGIPDVSDYADFFYDEPLPPLNTVWEINKQELQNIWVQLFEE